MDIQPSDHPILAKCIKPIHIVPLIRHIDEVQSTWLHLDGKAEGTPCGSQIQGHLPTVQISCYTDRRIGQSLTDKVVTEVADVDAPVLGERDAALEVDRMCRHIRGRFPFGISSPTQDEVVSDAEIFEQTKEVFILPLLLTTAATILAHIRYHFFLAALE